MKLIHRILALAFLAMPSMVFAADEPTGETIYRKQCAACHGLLGEGAKAFPHALKGDKSIPQLAALIGKTMPEDNPNSLKADDATRVASFVHETFYSKEAQERNKPPRVELARLTVSQYRNAVADLIGSFRPALKIDDRRGLKGEYFDARNFQVNKRNIDRIDPQVSFDFGVTGPIPEKFDANTFCIRWEGSVLAAETGDYEFVVRTEHATRLYLNDNAKPVVDAWVKSGNDTEYRTSIFLLAGRSYPLRLEFSKAKQGVDDSKKMKEKPVVKASVSLLWKRPKQALEIIPERYLVPVKTSETFVITTPFPPDDRSLGWERGTTVSREWDQATTDAALELASYMSSKLNELAGTKDGAADRELKVRDFARRFIERGFRKPITEEQKKLFLDQQFELARDPDLAMKRVILIVLKSPRFLYREVGGGPNAYDVAGRLAFSLWDAPPDTELLAAAAQGQLSTRDQVVKQAERMLADPRARAKIREFLLTWLKVDQAPDIAKDAKRYPDFDPAVIRDLRVSLEDFLDQTVWSSASDFRQLLLADYLPLNGRLAKFYGVDLPADAPFQNVKLNPEQRAGVLTHPYLLATFAYTSSTSPIHRGVFLARGILGLSMRPPPDAFTPLAEDLHPTLTTRERVALQTKQAACISCHGVINPLGFTLESFDAVGRFREKDNNKQVDSTGSYLSRTGKVVNFSGVRDLAKFLAGNEEVHAAFVEQLFHHLVKQPVRAYGSNTLPSLRESFTRNEFNIRKLAVEIVATTALPPTP